MGLSTAIIGIIYVITAVTYIALGSGTRNRAGSAPRYLPVWLALLSLWCLAEAVSQHIPAGMALIGWTSYVYFVPLFYVGSKLLANDHHAASTLRVTAIAGSIVGLGGIVGALMGASAPTLLLPITVAVGIHSSNLGNIYLSPSVFATSEEAAEQLLIALFAWAALSYLPSARPRRTYSAVVGVAIVGGLVAAERRADIYVAVIGIIALVILGRISSARTARSVTRVASRSRGRFGFPLIFAALGGTALLSILGASKLVSFITAVGSLGSRFNILFGVASLSFSGQGPGTSTQGGVLLGAVQRSLITSSHGTYPGYILSGRVFRTVEGGFSKTWLELGLVGVVLYGGAFFSALVPIIRSVTQLDGVGRSLTILTIALGVIFLKGHQSLDDPLVQPLFWLAAGGAWGRMRSVSRTRHGETETALPTDPVLSSPRAPAHQTQPG